MYSAEASSIPEPPAAAEASSIPEPPAAAAAAAAVDEDEVRISTKSDDFILNMAIEYS